MSGLVLLAAACSSSGSSSGGAASAGSSSSGAAASSAAASPTATSALCDDVAALRGSLQQLTSIKVSVNTVTELKAAAQDVQSNLSSLGSAAGSLWSQQIGSLKSALATLQTSIGTLATERNASSVAAVAAAVGAVAVAGRQLLNAATARCPSASASPTAS
ncbi:MAG: hypothetical protein ACLPKE_33150 [Streptosporangiaceae bacterium]